MTQQIDELELLEDDNSQIIQSNTNLIIQTDGSSIHNQSETFTVKQSDINFKSYMELDKSQAIAFDCLIKQKN